MSIRRKKNQIFQYYCLEDILGQVLISFWDTLFYVLTFYNM